MLRILDRDVSLCDGVSRREWLRVGGVGLSGLSLPQLLASRARAVGDGPRATQPKARSVILFWLTGGVPQHDTWDPKPDGPEHARSEFGAISTRTPGLHVGALMPKTAELTDRIAVLRAMVTGDNSHSSSGYQMLTGDAAHSAQPRKRTPRSPPNDWPSLGCPDVRAADSERRKDFPRRSRCRGISRTWGRKVWPGQDAGFLGPVNTIRGC